MSSHDADESIRAHYEEQSLTPEQLNALLALEQPRRRSGWLPLGLAASALLAVGLGGAGVVVVATTSMVASGPEELVLVAPEPAPTLDTGVPAPETVARRAPAPAPRPAPRPHTDNERRANGKRAEELQLRAQLEQLGYYAPSEEEKLRTQLEMDGNGEHDVVDTRLPPRPTPRPRRFHDTVAEPLSTFAADVDDASWIYVRDRIGDRQPPEPDRVRVEELVNAMPYHYAPPEQGDFAAHTAVVAHPSDPLLQLVRVGVQGRVADERPPMNLVFLVDTSGSMSGGHRMGLVKQAMLDILRQLRGRDTVSIVTFADKASVPVPATELGFFGRRTVESGIDALTASGSTGMSMGLDLAYAEAAKHHDEGVLTRVVLLSDGDANLGRLSGTSMAQSIDDYARDGIQLTAIGTSVDANGDRVMESLSNRGDGQYVGVHTPDDVRRSLVDGFDQVFVPLARDVKLQVDWDPDVVHRWRQVGYENRRMHATQFRQDAVDGGEVGMGHQVTALYVVERRPGTNDHALGELRLRYEPPGADTTATEKAFVLHAPVTPLRQADPDTVVAMAAAALGTGLVDRPIVPLTAIEPLLAEAATEPEHHQLLEAIRPQARREARPAPGQVGPSGVVSMQIDPGAFDELRVRCGDTEVVSTFTGGRAVASDLPATRCIADLSGDRGTVSWAVTPGESYRCTGEPIRCRAVE